jgi:hypothetical protein
MESPEFWKKLLPNLCDNSNRKNTVRACSISQKNMSQRRTIRGNAVTQPCGVFSNGDFRQPGENATLGQMPQLHDGHTLSAKRGKNAVGPFFLGWGLDLPPKHE